MKFFVFLLLVTLINFSVTNAEKPACRKWEQQVTNNLTKIFGHWHTFLQDKLLVKENDTCSEYTIEWNATLHAVDLINTQNYNDKSNKFIKGRAHKTAFPGVYDVVLDNGLMVVIRVGAMTDDFILFVGCFRNNDFIRILTKDKNPTVEVKKDIADMMVEYQLNNADLIYSCSVENEDEKDSEPLQ